MNLKKWVIPNSESQLYRPKVVIGVPVDNGEQYLSRALDL